MCIRDRYLPAQQGSITDPEGNILGEHDGLMFYTLGQRQGLKIGGRRNSAESPWYVVEKKITENILVVAQGHEHPLLFSSSLKAEQVHWIHEMPVLPLQATAKTRYRQPAQDCIISATSATQYQIDFKLPQRAITPGQSVVFYQNEVCLGGGIIVT